MNRISSDKNSIAEHYNNKKNFLIRHSISISTITLDCKLKTIVLLDNFAKNVKLREDGIVSVKYGNRKDTATNRTIVVLKSKKKPSNKNFYNQVTVLIKPKNNVTRGYINIKVFKNGSLQMTGCKDMDDFYDVTKTLISILTIGYNSSKGHISFIEDYDNIGIYDARIRMINSNFKVDFKIDRKELTRILKDNHGLLTKDARIGYVECKYEPTGGHSCVNIKYKYDDQNKPSIFVFQTGAIIITGAKNLDHIVKSYKFIMKILMSYYDAIRIPVLDKNEVRNMIDQFYKRQQNSD